ncbi:hypothetical protein LPJ61_000655 [Coemansia biformis]|uniref:DUF1682-domain-containing protein n=1 Tax=Coemansia biformis TaxID=1286918 RepID=A0A9W7YGP2_9FUNG|nr:hypothetical protein LPJ61_000655 [Coemansia biformis]
MRLLVQIALLALACVVLLAGRAAADELGNVPGEVPPPRAQAAAGAEGRAASAPEPALSNYMLEALLAGLAAGLVANYVRGSRQNAALAAFWEKTIGGVLRANFSVVGDGRQVLERDSASDMLFYASGRRHCRFAQGHLMLSARQDPVALLTDLVGGGREKLELEVVLDDDASSGFVFAAVPRKRARAVGRDRYDIATFASAASNSRVPENLVVFSECADATTQMLDSGLDELLADEGCLLEEIHVTDSPAEKPETHDFERVKKLLATIRLPAPTDDGARRFGETLAFVFYLVDYIAEAVRLRPESARKIAKSRDAAFREFARLAEQKKQEAVAKIAADKRRTELDEVGKMSPEQRRRWEERDRKRALKKSLGKRTRVVK